MQNVALLDRNVVSMIKACNKNGSSGDRERRIRLNKIRQLDKPWNFISPILAINEGQRGAVETPEQFTETMQSESAAIGKFFQSARTDTKFLTDLAISSEFPNGFRETNFDKYLQFLRQVSPGVIQPQAPDTWKAKRNNILKIADELGVPRGHIIVLCVISALYRNRASIGILNPRIEGDKTYNAASDLMVVSRISHLETIDATKSIKFRFVTFDKHLLDFLSHIRQTRGEYVSDSPTPEGMQHIVSYDVNPKLFPDLGDDELHELRECFAGASTK